VQSVQRSILRSNRSVQTVQRSVHRSNRSVQTVQRSTGVVLHFRVCSFIPQVNTVLFIECSSKP
jgi:hypothetical protein